MSLASGAKLGPYEIVAPIGEGGMGVVYRARDPRLDRQVGIKLLPSSLAGDPAARERLRREAMAAAGLDHPYICKVYEIGEDGETRFLVMEYVAGRTLHARLSEGRMPLDEAVRVAGEVAEALREAHAQGIVHRDLKPANIMLTAQGHVKVMDFGLAKRMAPVAAPHDLTCTTPAGPLTAQGAIVGTPDYMSPEQIKGLPVDARSDLFSFGVILAEMAGGRHPFRQASTMETFAAVLREPPGLSGDIPPPMATMIARLLAKEPGDRYASIADVRADLAAVGTPAATSIKPPRAAAGSLWKWPAILVTAAIVAVVISLVARRGATPPAVVEAPGVIRSIAVLPLDNYSGDASQDFFAEGMTEEITTVLATISQLRVISRGSVMQFKGDKRPSTPDIAKLLNVDAIVEGSAIRSGDKVRITAQLIDARADKHLWARSFERSSRDVLALQDELAAAIANEIHVQLTPAERSRLMAARTVDPEAHDAYLKGRYFFNRPSDDNLKKAIAHFEEAVRLNPNFAPALSGLSDAYLWAGYNEGFLTAAAAKPKAKTAAEQAIQVDDNSAEAHASLATFKLFCQYDWAGAEREYRRSFALNPNYAFAHDQFGLGLAFQGRFDEALAEGRRASELDPLSPQIPLDRSIAYMFQGDYDRAREQAKKAEELDPTFFFPPFEYGWLAIEAKKFSEAIAPLRKAKTMDAPAFVTAWLAYALAMSGDRAQAKLEIDELKKLSLGGEVTAFNLAVVNLAMGDHKRALDYLDRAYADDSQWMGWLNKDRMFDPLRTEPRFIALMKKLGFAQ
jgi:TolB-like protein/Tfp pilus assembly protein PilF/predicted Ser/Thr protein kinase